MPISWMSPRQIPMSSSCRSVSCSSLALVLLASDDALTLLTIRVTAVSNPLPGLSRLSKASFEIACAAIGVLLVLATAKLPSSLKTQLTQVDNCNATGACRLYDQAGFPLEPKTRSGLFALLHRGCHRALSHFLLSLHVDGISRL